MSSCKSCGKEVRFVNDRVGRPIPFDRSGADHRESCAGVRQETRHRIRDENHEAAVENFLKRCAEAGGRKSKPAVPTKEGDKTAWALHRVAASA